MPTAPSTPAWPSTNQSQAPMERAFYSEAFTVTTIVAMATIMFMSIVGNAVIIVIFRSFNHVRKQVTNHFLINLAISDLIVALATMPFWLLWEIDGWQSLPDSWDSEILDKLWLFIDIACEATSIANLVVISIDRLYSVSKPFKHHTQVTPALAHKIIFCTWVYALLTASLHLLEWRWKFVIITAISFFIPLTIMIVCYTSIVLAVRACRRRWSAQPNENRQLFGSIVNEYKTAKNLAIVMLTFVLCWLPFFICSLVIQYSNFCSEHPRRCLLVTSITKILHYLNSAINPILYTFLNPSFRVVFRRYYAWCVRRENYRCTKFEAWYLKARRTSLTSNRSGMQASSLTIANRQRGSCTSTTYPDKRSSCSSTTNGANRGSYANTQRMSRGSVSSVTYPGNRGSHVNTGRRQSRGSISSTHKSPTQLACADEAVTIMMADDMTKLNDDVFDEETFEEEQEAEMVIDKEDVDVEMPEGDAEETKDDETPGVKDGDTVL